MIHHWTAPELLIPADPDHYADIIGAVTLGDGPVGRIGQAPPGPLGTPPVFHCARCGQPRHRNRVTLKTHGLFLTWECVAHTTIGGDL